MAYTAAEHTNVTHRTSATHMHHDLTACDTGFFTSTSRMDSLGELSRRTIFVRGYIVEGSAEITDVKPVEITGISA